MKILVPVDGSEHSLKALDLATTFAEDLHAQVVVLCVVNLGEVALLSAANRSCSPAASNNSK